MLLYMLVKHQINRRMEADHVDFGDGKSPNRNNGTNLNWNFSLLQTTVTWHKSV